MPETNPVSPSPNPAPKIVPKVPQVPDEKTWRLSNAPKLSVEEAMYLLNPEMHTTKDRERLKWSRFYPQVTMGMDPEFFLANEAGVPIPAFQVLASKKDNPYLFWDGFQAECTVEPRSCHQELAQNLAEALGRVRHKILPTPVWRVPKELLLSAEHDHVRLGCDPSYNVYNMRGKHVEDGRELGWRFAGGHVHFTLSEAWKIPPRVRSIIRAEDALLAVPSVCFAQGIDLAIRRKYYGLPGEFRLPRHGIEYRTLSNFWMYHPQAYHLVFDLARFAFNIGKAGLRCYIGDPDLVVNIVQFGDVRAAKDLVKLNAPLYEAFLQRYPDAARKAFWRAIEQGFKSVIPNFGRDVNLEWRRVRSAFNQPMWQEMK